MKNGTFKRCSKCDQRFGTEAGFKVHRTLSKCKTARTLERYHGMWKGFHDVWWTTDLGWDDPQ